MATCLGDHTLAEDESWDREQWEKEEHTWEKVRTKVQNDQAPKE